MQAISSNNAKQSFGQILDSAQRNPVLIQKHNHPVAVILSISEYVSLCEGKEYVPATIGSIAGAPTITRRPLPKSLPVYPATRGSFVLPTLSPKEMVDLVKNTEADMDSHG